MRRVSEKRFGDDTNDTDVQLQRLQQLEDMAKLERSNGLGINIEPWDVIHAKSTLGDAAGPDGIPPRVWKSVPFIFSYACMSSFRRTRYMTKRLPLQISGA